MGEIVLNVAYVIGQLLFELLRYYTAKILLPVISLGVLRVQSLTAKNAPSFFWQRPFTRLPSGHVEVSIPIASAFGLIFWFVLIIVVVHRYGTG